MDLSGHEGEIPIPISSSYVGGGHGHGHSIIHESTPSLHHPSNGPPPPPHPPPPPLSSTAAAAAAADDHHHHQHHHYYNNTNAPKKGAAVKYRECLKNHAASIGGNATDGCGEFMPSGEEGTLEALKCSACSCHRNFHRKEAEGEAAAACDCYHSLNKGGRKMLMGQKGLLISGPDHPHHHAFGSYGPAHAGNSFIPRPHHVGMIMPLGAMQSSESDDVEGAVVGGGGGRALPHHAAKKRFRTKFTPEQKEKMLSFAEKAGWRLQRQEESVVQQFCQEIGVKRRVLKVWMHNNKHSLAKKNPLPLE
uniref:ZF-HD dimerization-type domain-containing protein n=1 Tax=Ananas comosus var. bracteatus TaxID=296719 RepID=A0A6V7QGB6_ANACO|nr:unnamed protein product [Ananas comosus var. bracteatus]